MLICVILISTTLIWRSSAQFSSQSSSIINFPSVPINTSGATFNTFQTRERDFSNFVDLPSQRLQDANTNPRNSPGFTHCALNLGINQGCITYESVDKAFIAARDRITDEPLRSSSESGNFTNADVGNLGNVIHETARDLAETYNLPVEVLTDGLGQIDTSRTIISKYCPRYLQKRRCSATRYRGLEGICNNLDNPLWGAAQVAHHRFLPYAYSDGISAPRIALSGNQLPSPRLISAHAHRDENIHDHSITILMVAWAQFTDHDMTLTAEIDEILEDDLNCCQGPNITHPMCFPIRIPENDHFFSKHSRTCMNFVRSNAGLRPECKLGPREQFNQITSVIDAGVVYSNVPETTEKLRTHERGQMKMLPVFDREGLKPLLPLNLEDPDKGCIRPNGDVFCFFTGDPRVNEQTVLCMLHTLFIREHNRIALELHGINPHWTDETLFQETRRIIIAMEQHITFSELLPLILGKAGLQEHGLNLYRDGFYDLYDETINPSSASGFTTAAFRFGHSLLPSTIERWNKNHKFIGTQKLSEMIQQPYDLFKAGWADTYLMGMVNQVAQAMDDGVTSQVTNHLFEEPGDRFGLDLVALNIQRGREHGIPSYNRYREWCGFQPILRWSDLQGIMKNTSIQAYSKIYETPEDLDLFTAGISEIPLPERLLGPTFSCIIGRQFHNVRRGDRFWYENGGWPSSFTMEQLTELRKASLARIFCDNSNDIDTIQMRAMLLPDHVINPRVSCRSSVIPRINLEFWRDIP